MTGNQLRKLIDGLGVSQAALARDIGISDRQVRRYCSGEAKIPKLVEMALRAVSWELTADVINVELAKESRKGKQQ
jgi:transcriptional regulator with XRE-family HTH domain